MKCRGRPRKSWPAQVDLLKKELVLQDRALDINNQKALEKRECEEFEVALRHQSKLRVYTELKQEIRFEEFYNM